MILTVQSKPDHLKSRGSGPGLLPVLSGVPQGSILGLLLFLLYINDLTDCLVSSTMYMFADDSKCMHIIRNSDDTINFQDDLMQFCLSLVTDLEFTSLSKTAFIQYGNNAIGTTNYLFNGTEIKTKLNIYQRSGDYCCF